MNGDHGHEMLCACYLGKGFFQRKYSVVSVDQLCTPVRGARIYKWGLFWENEDPGWFQGCVGVRGIFFPKGPHFITPLNNYKNVYIQYTGHSIARFFLPSRQWVFRRKDPIVRTQFRIFVESAGYDWHEHVIARMVYALESTIERGPMGVIGRAGRKLKAQS